MFHREKGGQKDWFETNRNDYGTLFNFLNVKISALPDALIIVYEWFSSEYKLIDTF